MIVDVFYLTLFYLKEPVLKTSANATIDILAIFALQ